MCCKSLQCCSNIKDTDMNSRHFYLLPVFSKLVQGHTAYDVSKHRNKTTWRNSVRISTLTVLFPTRFFSFWQNIWWPRARAFWGREKAVLCNLDHLSLARDMTTLIESLGCSLSYVKPALLPLVTEVKEMLKVLHLTVLMIHALAQVAS